MAAPAPTSFKKTIIRSQPKPVSSSFTKDTQFWDSFEFPITKKEYGPIIDVNFSPTEPYQYAVASSSRIQIYSCQTNQIVKTFSKFKENVLCGRYRKDGKILATGTEAGLVKLYNIESKSCLRMLRGHWSAVHAADFLTDGYRVISCSNDQTSILWDIAEGQKILTLKEHKDSVRSCAVNPSAKDILLTGSYDQTAKLFDLRTQACVQTVHHGAPIEDVLMFNTGTVFFTAGGNYVRVWDSLAGGKLLMELTNHHKTVTCLTFAQGSKRLLTGGLDRHVKIYDSSTYQVVHSLDFPAPVLSMGCSKDNKTFAVGMADGMLSVRRRKIDAHLSKQEKRRKAFQFKIQKHSFKPSKDAHVIQHQRKEHLAKYDSYLKSFQHAKALDAVLESKVCLKHPEVTVSVMEELIRRDVIKPAVAGRDEKSIDTLLRFLSRHITNSQYTRTLVDVVNVLLDVYTEHPDRLSSVYSRLIALSNVINNELKYEEQLMQLLGTMDTILCMSNSTQDLAPTLIKSSESGESHSALPG